MIVFNAFFKPNLLLNVHAHSMSTYHHSSHIAGNWAPKVITDTLWQKCHSCIRFFYGAYQPKYSWPPGIMSRRERIVKEVSRRTKFVLPESELLSLFFAALARTVVREDSRHLRSFCCRLRLLVASTFRQKPGKHRAGARGK